MVLKIYLLLILFSVVTMTGLFMITERLMKVSKSNKFRNWWSNNIVDLDNSYKD